MTTSPTTLWLIRHGETAQAYRGRCYGSLDVDLSPEGLRQMENAAAWVAPSTIAAVYCSPRIRCLRGAEIIAAGHACPVLPIPALSELNFGQFEGRTYDEIAASCPEFYRLWMSNPTEVQFPGGESFTAMRQRVLSAAAELRAKHSGSSYAIVAHGGVNRIILADVLAVPAERIFRIGQRYAAVNLIRYYPGHPVVELLNVGIIPSVSPK